jgi:Mn-dependent DtxR family transcriptional regulator
MAELREAHLRYLLAIYELGKSNPDVGTQAVAKALNCSKASVTKMMATLMDMNLLVREKYGKIYLTDTGFLLAKDMLRCVEVICDRLPAVGFDLTREETAALARAIVLSLPEHCQERLARHGDGRKTEIMK